MVNEIGKYVLVGIFVLAILAIGYIVVQNMNIPIPQWFVNILGIIILAVIAGLGVKFLMKTSST